jgi:hypothetical protein
MAGACRPGTAPKEAAAATPTPTPTPAPSARPAPRPRRALPRTFAVYYGRGPLRALEAFELVVLEPRGWAAGDLSAVRAGRGRVLAYLSVLEADEQSCREAGLGRGDLLQRGGRPWFKPEWGTWVADPRAPRWRRFVAARAATLAADGWHGLFLDTVGDVEDDAVRQDAAWLLPAAAELVRLVRQAAGERLLVQNHGLLLLLPYVAACLDGVCWEAPPLAAFGREAWADRALQRVLSLSLRHDLMVLLLDRAPADATGAAAAAALEAFAARHGCLAYTAPVDYHLGVRLPDGRCVPAAPG